MHVARNVLAIALGAMALLGASPAPSPSPSPQPTPVAGEIPDAVTQHTVTINGTAYAYTARAGTITLTNEQEQPTARMFYTAYTLGGDSASRPLTFLQRRPGQLDDVAAHGIVRSGARACGQRPALGAAA